MVAPPSVWENPALTGRVRYRSSLFGKVVLQVEEMQRLVTLHAPGAETYSSPRFGWRDAKWGDTIHIGVGQSVGGPTITSSRFYPPPLVP